MLRIFILLLLVSCADQGLYKPKPAGLGSPPEDSPEMYKLGWDHGCDTGLSTMVLEYYKTFYKFKQDPDLVNNTMYHKAWKDSYTYCRQYAFRYTWDAFDRQSNSANKNLCILCQN